MLRIQNLFAFATIGLLAVGLLASRLWLQTSFVIGTRGRGYGLSHEMLFYFLAALFAAFAFVYPIGYIPFSATMARWHFWSSLVSLLICIAGWSIFCWYANRISGTEVGPAGRLVLASFVAAFLTFVSMQLWFAIDLARALFKMRGA